MPLNKSKSEGAFHENVAEMIRAGHPQKQALAAAYRVMRGYDDGGTVDPVVLPQDPNPLADNPFSHYVAQKLYGLGQNAASALSVPGEVWKGNLDPTSDEGMDRAIGLAQMITEAPRGGGAGTGTVLGSGIRAYHGSPYDFDRFDMSKIGTGEGAQSYGHGLYFAENEGVARSYRDALTQNSGKTNLLTSYRDGILDDSPRTFERFLAARFRQNEGDLTRTISQLETDLKANPKDGTITQALDLAKNPDAKLNLIDRNPGRMYEVNINAHPDEFLDWDKPLGNQSYVTDRVPDIVEAAKKEAYNRALATTHKDRSDQLWGMVKNPLQAPGEFALDALVRGRRGVQSADTSAMLRDAGIHGIKYLDQGSRNFSLMKPEPHTFLDNSQGWRVNGPRGDQLFDTKQEAQDFINSLDKGTTRNYVVFNDKLIDILRKYGLAGLTAGAGAIAAGQQIDNNAPVMKYADGGSVDPVVLPQDPNPMADNPFSHYVAQKLFGIGQGVVDAATLPGDVYAGRVDPTSDEGGERAFNLAQMMTGAPRGGSVGSGVTLPPKGIRAYHGSPYDFDRFDLSKIGTGEGAQVYGHGLYFAENEGVARNYRDQLAKSTIRIGDQSVAPAEVSERIWKGSGNDTPDFLSGIMDAVHEFTANGKQPSPPADLSSWMGYGSMPKRQGYAYASEYLKGIEPNPGRMYEVNINAHPDEFLSSDLNLNKQSPFVKDALRGAGIYQEGPYRSGALAYQDLADRGTLAQGLQQRQAQASDMLREAGIPGIKYLDQGSRGSGTGTSNYVVFNDKLIDILRKYGLAGLTAGAGATAVAGQNDMKYASGGNVLPFYARSEARNLEHSGFIHSPVPGRTDRLPMGVRGGSYVLPADTVSAVGQGNSLAGAHALTRLFGMGPYGSSMPHISGGRPSIPKLPSMKPPKFARGGPVDIVAAGGEMVIPPHVVAQIGKGDMKLGHDILDAFVKHTRAKTVKKLKSLPDPKKK